MPATLCIENLFTAAEKDELDLGYIHSAYTEAQSSINAHWMRNVLSDIDLLKLISRIEDIEERLSSFYQLYIETHYYKSECATLGTSPIAVPRYMPSRELQVGGTQCENFKQVILSFCRMIRSLINDVLYAGIINTRPQLKAMGDCDPSYVNVHTSVLTLEKSLRDTMSYLHKATSELVSTTSTGYTIDSPEIRGMISGIIQVMVGSIAANAGINGHQYYLSDFFAVKGPDKISSKTLTGAATHVVEAFLGLYGAPISDEEISDSSPLVVCEHLISVLAGVKLNEVKNFSRRLIEISGARARMKKSIHKHMQLAKTGGATGRKTTTSKINRMTIGERTKFAHPGLAPIAVQKMMKKRSVAVERETPEASGLGHVYLVLDCSGSTLYGGGKIKTCQLFENIALSIADSCSETDQDFTCLFYGNSVFNIVHIPKKAKPEEKRALRRQLAGNGGNFENDEHQAFNVAIDYIDRDQRLKGKEPATLLFLTDGMILTSGSASGMTAATQLQLELETRKASMDLKILPIVVYDSIDTKFCTAFRGDQFVHVEDAAAFGVAHLEDIMAYVADVPLSKRRDTTIKAVPES